jgi:hypothetical protein
MKTINIISLVAIIPLVAVANFSQAGTPDNKVDFKFKDSTLEYFKYDFIKDEKNYKITIGQTFDGVSSSIHKTNEGQVVVSAGRKGSVPPADWFKHQVTGGATSVMHCAAGGNTPNELNFAVIGDMTFLARTKEHGFDVERYVTCNNIVLGQGNTGSKNNWWAGSSKMTGSDNNYKQSCTDKFTGKLITVKFGGYTGCISTFDININQTTVNDQ